VNIVGLDVSRNSISYVPNEIGSLVKVTTPIKFESDYPASLNDHQHACFEEFIGPE